MQEKITINLIQSSIKSKRQIKHGASIGRNIFENVCYLKKTKKSKITQLTDSGYITFKSA